MSQRTIGVVCAAAFVATVWAANYAVEHWGIVSVGFGLEAPAGVYLVGVAFTLRDIVHRTIGRAALIAAILAGAALSAWVSDSFTVPGGYVPLAVASLVAFSVSELSDLAFYEITRGEGWLPAVAISNVVGLLVDSLLFLWLAFGSLAFLWGQVTGKAWMTVAAIVVLAAARSRTREIV